MATQSVGPQIEALLQRYGLGELVPWLSDLVTHNVPEEEIMLQLYDQPAFKRAYPELEARATKARDTGVNMTPLSVDDVLNYRTQAKELMRFYGLPASFYAENGDFFDLIVNDVSMDELNTRLETVSTRVANAPPEVRATFGELFGAAADDAMFALFVDDERAMPELENMVQTAEAGGAARRMGFDLQRQTMERLSTTNLSYNQMLQGFTVLDATRSLYEESISEEQDYTVEKEGIEATFGLGGGAQAKINSRAETRTASTQGRAGGLQEDRGSTSLGGAGRR